jgi:hypothetical protein
MELQDLALVCVVCKLKMLSYFLFFAERKKISKPSTHRYMLLINAIDLITVSFCFLTCAITQY